MLSMSKLRDNSKGMMWTLLFFFIASMTVGGLVGGANIITTIQGFFGKVNTSLYVGKVGNDNISISYYLNERQKQLNRFRQQGRSIDSRAIQNAGDFAWNNIVDRAIKDKKIEEFNLFVQDDEIFDFLLLSPPQAFQDNLKSLGLYKDENDNFLLDEYQNAIRFGTLPDTTNQILFLWENYLREYLADRKLQNLYNNATNITNFEILENYKSNSLNCTLDILSININSINDSLIKVSKEEVLQKYNEDKEDNYKIDERVVLEYVLWNNINPSDLDSLDIIDKQDSLLQLSIDFSSEANMTSFSEAMEYYEITTKDTIYATEGFKNNSGFPFQMGVMRSAARFAFDNSIGSVSEQITTDNGIAVFHIVGNIGEEYKPISEVENSIKRSLIHDKKKEYAQLLFNDINIDSDWKEISNNSEYIAYTEKETSTLGGNFNTIGRSNELQGILKKIEPGEFTNVLESSSHVFVAYILEKDKFNQDNYLAAKDSIKKQLLASKRNQTYNNWLRAEKESIEIIDLRYKIF